MDLRVKLSRQLLKNALLEILEEKPLGKVTIKEICEKAEINRTTFYKHYKDEYDLYNDLENDFLDLISKEVSQTGNEIISLLNSFKGNKKLTRVILLNPADPDIMKKVFDRIAFKINFEGKYSKQITEFSFSGIAQLIVNWVGNKYDMSVEEMNELIQVIFDQLLNIQ